jgi:hypothetical protein
MYNSLENGALTIAMPTLDSMKIPYEKTLKAYLPDNFVLTIQGSALVETFLRDEQDQVEYLRSRAFVGKKVEMPDAGLPPLPPPSVQRDTKTWLKNLKTPVWTPRILPAP